MAIQAKCYSSPLSNSPVQEVAAARAHHNCNKATVVTNNSFTVGARELAKTTGVELIEGETLKKMLVDDLKESWV